MHRRVTKSLFALLLAPLALSQTLKFAPVPQELIESRLGTYTRKNDQRAGAVRRLFADAGCLGDAMTEQPVKGLKAPNLICTLRGTTESVIVVGAHFDLVEDGDGVVDNWTGASLLASLYQGLASIPRQHTFRFVAFSGEEQGLVGSTAYVKEAQKVHEPIAAMVNMDTLGLTESEVWVNGADPKLVDLIGLTAAALKLPVSGMNVENVGSTDSAPFRDRKIPAITIHSLTTGTVALLHSPRDRISAVHMDEYYRTYRLVLGYLAMLDLKLD